MIAIKQIKAMRASKIEAYRELSEQVNGIYIRATDTLNSSNIETSNSVKSEVDGFVPWRTSHKTVRSRGYLRNRT